MSETRIRMAQVLAEIDQYEIGGRLHTFSLNYIKTNGQKGFKERVRKSGNYSNHPTEGTKKESGNKFRINIKNNGLFMLVDNRTGQPFALKISLLTHYNGQRIRH
ncbi:hypothetical protein [Adhaeribacter pallidiroseus]|uniref:Uncharacterized protein n=1 Tax=Adhaeribacter pallidiroseus TaxID=2072847 RepID=A0A369QJ48_9BACT|nr:hypothetical protein [Adhaeribacter pallidiroseus]RDC63277.1 hypothetical protein AHMF7616_01879 [Adhaeribacter pallidiroseus]